MHQLGIKKNIGFLIDKLNSADSFKEAAETVIEQFGITLILRQRLRSDRQKQQFPNEKEYHTFRRGHLLVEEHCEDTPNSAILCNAEVGFLEIRPDESVIIISGKPHGNVFLIYINFQPELTDYFRIQFGINCAAQCTMQFRLNNTIT